MGKTIALWSIAALCLLLTAFVPLSMGATKGESTIEFGKEYTLSGTATAKWYIAVNAGDNITVNVSDAPAGTSAQIDIDTALIYTESSNDTMMNNSYVIPYGPMKFWFKCAYSQRIGLTFMTAAPASMIYKVTKVNGTNQMAEDISALKQNVTALNLSLTNLSAWANTTFTTLNSTLAALNSTLANLTQAFLANLSIANNYTAYLNASIGELNASMLALIDGLNALIDDINANLSKQFQNITDLWKNAGELWTNLSYLGIYEMEDFNRLTAQLAALNASLRDADAMLWVLVQMNDTALKGLLEANNGSLNNSILGLSERLTALRGEVQNISFPTPKQYNDTLLWKEIARINATPPVTIVQVNNTTVVNKTEVNPTTFVNRTETLSTEGNGALAGAITGIVTASAVGGGGLVYFERRLKKRYGGMV